MASYGLHGRRNGSATLKRELQLSKTSKRSSPVLVALCSSALTAFITLWLIHSPQAPQRGELDLPIWREERNWTSLPIRTEEQYSHAEWQRHLLPWKRYLTAGDGYGPTNQFLCTCSVSDYLHGSRVEKLMPAIVNILYLAKYTHRIPILPPLDPRAHVRPRIWSRFSLYWDMPSFTALTGIPVLEWADLRDNVTTTPDLSEDRIGCWAIVEALRQGKRIELNSLDFVGIQKDLWPMPPWLTYQREFRIRDSFLTVRLWDLLFQQKRDWTRRITQEQDIQETVLTPAKRLPPPFGARAPDEQLLCFDNIYYLQDLSPERTELEVMDTYNGTFAEIGQFLRWTPLVSAQADQVLRATLGSATKPYIAMHMRRGDFVTWWVGAAAIKDFKNAIDRLYIRMEARSDLRYLNPRRMPVFVVSDENDAAFWEQIEGLGWKRYDHELHNTFATSGDDPWRAGIIDQVILSRAHGLVTSWYSTFSEMAIMRARAWQGAEFVIVEPPKKTP